ncbi:uncharacterized protein LOC117180422 [Belonocnema kinseyi]|uniref:uncharacterized protein LOC117180422 n=1 Tax=Belonocnema kinseyi TaxID=2817044 RepID=UPI00143DDAF3|nr:uncharacterized protein LOC117180422 [Belonocnema kinseyi]
MVIHDHVAECIFVGNTGRKRVYLRPLPHDYEIASPTGEIEVPNNFPAELQAEFRKLLKLHAPLFHGGGRLKQTLANVQHHIQLKDSYPFREAPRRYSDEKRQYIDVQVREMLRDGITEPTTSPFSSAIVIVGKKDGDYRFCVDYRRLNGMTVDAPQCLPSIHETLKDLELGGTLTPPSLSVRKAQHIYPNHRTGKVLLCQTTLPYLGHMVSTEGNSAQTGHVEAIRSAAPPRTRKEMRSFLGICNWVKEYITNSSIILAPLSDMLSTKRPYKMTPENRQHFENAKAAFQKPITLSRPDPELRFVLQTDASARGMGAVLMQDESDGKWRIISFASAKFSPTEARYHCNEQECLAIVWAIKSRFSRTVEHVPGKKNELPDALSRHPNPGEFSPGEPDMGQMLLPTVKTVRPDSATTVPVLSALARPPLYHEVIEAQQEDSAITRDVLRWKELAGMPHPTLQQREFLDRHRLTNKGWWCQDTAGAWRLRVPTALRMKVIWEFHDAAMAGHPGTEETIRSIRESFF